MKSFSRDFPLALGVAVGLLTVSLARAELTPAEQAAAFKAAGFKKARSGQYNGPQGGHSLHRGVAGHWR